MSVNGTRSHFGCLPSVHLPGGGTSLRAMVWGECACSRIWMESRVSRQLWFLELFLRISPLPSESTAAGSGIWGPQLWASRLLACSILYVEPCLQDLLPRPLEPVHFPFCLGPLFLPTVETTAMVAVALGTGALCLLVCCLLALRGAGAGLQVLSDPSWSGPLSSKLCFASPTVEP